jgi:cyclopropane-fatty-acyl-phospholipid synthase
MAQHYVVRVRAFNISREQIEYARLQTSQLGLCDQVEFIEDDWRNISGKCDAFVSVGEMMEIFVPNRFSILDVENLRQHYAETLHHWLTRFENHANQIELAFGKTFLRTWRFYLTGSMAAFAVGSLQLFQVLFTRGSNNNLPRSRRFIYEDSSQI